MPIIEVNTLVENLEIGDVVLVSRFKIDLLPGLYNPPPPPVPKVISNIEPLNASKTVYLSFESGEKAIFDKNEQIIKQLIL